METKNVQNTGEWCLRDHMSAEFWLEHGQVYCIDSSETVGNFPESLEPWPAISQTQPVSSPRS